MSLKDRYQKEDFLLVTEEVFASTYPSEEEKDVMYQAYKQACEEALALPKTNARTITRLQDVAASFLTDHLNKEYQKEAKEIESFIRQNKLQNPQAVEFRAEARGSEWVLIYKGLEVLSVPKISLGEILQKYLQISCNPFLVALSSQEKEGILQAYWGFNIVQHKNSLKS